jgi:hypothetical protein
MGNGQDLIGVCVLGVTDGFLAESTSNVMESGNAVNLRFGMLRNGNPPGNPHLSPRCGAKTRSGAPCRAPGVWNRKTGKYGRCRMHGGKSTGPRTPEGIERCRKANWKHGERSAEHIAYRRAFRRELQWMRWEGDQLERELRVILRERKRQQRADQQLPLITVLYVGATPNDRDV